jgi:hypothetical protein
MIREITHPSSARYTLPMYIGFLLSEPKQGSCCRLAEVMGISHDSAPVFCKGSAMTARICTMRARPPEPEGWRVECR